MFSVQISKLMLDRTASGCGLVGLVFGMLGSRVVLTDCHEQIHLLLKNIEINGLDKSCEACNLDMDNSDEGATAKLELKFYDFVVATADIEGSSPDKIVKMVQTIVKVPRLESAFSLAHD